MLAQKSVLAKLRNLGVIHPRQSTTPSSPNPNQWQRTTSLVATPRLLSMADRFGDILRPFHRPWSAGQLMRSARQRTGLCDFGDRSFEQPLAFLLRSYDEEANLSTFGRAAARWDMLRFLSNLLILREAETRDPAILSRSIAQPIFITGLPRSGSSF